MFYGLLLNGPSITFYLDGVCYPPIHPSKRHRYHRRLAGPLIISLSFTARCYEWSGRGMCLFQNSRVPCSSRRVLRAYFRVASVESHSRRRRWNTATVTSFVLCFDMATLNFWLFLVVLHRWRNCLIQFNVTRSSNGFAREFHQALQRRTPR